MKKPIIGYQIETANGKHELPNCFYSFEIFSKEFAKEWVEASLFPTDWVIVPIYEGDIEEPTFID